MTSTPLDMSTPDVPASPAPMKKATAGAKKPVKPRGPAKPKATSSHPAYSDMVVTALRTLKEHGGSSRQALLKYIMANYKVGTDTKMINAHIKSALKRGVATGALKLTKGTGASGRFRVGEPKGPVTKAKKPKAPKKKTTTAAKPRAKKTTTATHVAASESSAKAKKAKKPKTTKPKAAGPSKVKKPTKAAKSKAPKKPKAPKAKKPATAKPKKAPAKKTA
ncbi:histoneo; histone h3; histone h1 [Trichuris trichiura]|uniref:Histoneo histone h3 histone h1 n=1 Tax=Trichuris trichiura TaxID=36087 RepID=A0A077ZI97_TRITR|nr:histoneo; histone h3; histone h1 [Trichuris trichiura]